MGNYHDIYLEMNILSLAEILEKFISTSLEYYGLYPCQSCNSPELSWDERIKRTETELGLISDIDMYLFVEKWMRVGISYMAKRFSKANNKYMQSYDYIKPSKYIK